MTNTEQDYGNSARSLSATLRTSKITSELFDPPLAPPEPPRYLPRYWMTRLYITASLLARSLVIFLVPNAATAILLDGSALGWAMLTTLAICCLVGVLDVFINDLAPPGYALPSVRRHRQWVFMGIALSILGLTYAIVCTSGWSPVLITYAVDFSAALIVAPLDLFARHRGR